MRDNKKALACWHQLAPGWELHAEHDPQLDVVILQATRGRESHEHAMPMQAMRGRPYAGWDALLDLAALVKGRA